MWVIEEELSNSPSLACFQLPWNNHESRISDNCPSFFSSRRFADLLNILIEVISINSSSVASQFSRRYSNREVIFSRMTMKKEKGDVSLRWFIQVRTIRLTEITLVELSGKERKRKDFHCVVESWLKLSMEIFWRARLSPISSNLSHRNVDDAKSLAFVDFLRWQFQPMWKDREKMSLFTEKIHPTMSISSELFEEICPKVKGLIVEWNRSAVHWRGTKSFPPRVLIRIGPVSRYKYKSFYCIRVLWTCRLSQYIVPASI